MELDYRQLLLQFIATIAIDDADPSTVGESIEMVLETLDIDIDWSQFTELAQKLGKMGITTLHGTPLDDLEDEEGYGDFEEWDGEQIGYDPTDDDD